MANVSVIISCYNRSQYIRQTVTSILNQSLAQWQLVLVDDGSTDDTWEEIARLCALDARISGYQKLNGGTPAKTRNFGYSRCDPHSKYLFFLDDDDLLEPSALEKMSAYLDAHPEVGLLGCQFRNIDATGVELGPGKRDRWVPGRLFPRRLQDHERATPFVSFYCATGQGPFAM